MKSLYTNSLQKPKESPLGISQGHVDCCLLSRDFSKTIP